MLVSTCPGAYGIKPNHTAHQPRYLQLVPADGLSPLGSLVIAIVRLHTSRPSPHGFASLRPAEFYSPPTKELAMTNIT
jgi:hypothetical protein